jgi:hypothetical protein
LCCCITRSGSRRSLARNPGVCRSFCEEDTNDGAACLKQGANATTLSYNAVIKIYRATNSKVRFYNENYFYPVQKRSSLLQRWRFSCKFIVG